jgi:lysophospholipase L1-like esterase
MVQDVVRTRNPVTIAALVGAGLVSWTCTQGPIRADAPDAPELAAGGEDDLHTRGDTEAVAEAMEAPAERDLTVYVDEGMPGLRIPVHDPSGRALDGFYAGLERARSGGKARIAVWGASHVAADFFTGYVREQLQSRFGDAGHGFILPAQPWRSYRHLHVDVESNWRRWDTHRIRTGNWVEDHYGYAGVAVESDRSDAWGAVTTAEHGAIGRHAGVYDVWFLKQEGGGDFDVFIDGRRVGRVPTAGEERAPGYAAFQVEDGPHRFEVRVRGNGPVRLFGVVVERESPGVVVDTLGINGARVQSHLYWHDALYREHLRRRAPDMVVLAYGTNESGDDDVPIEEYEARLRQVVARMREVVPEASCLLVGPTDRPMVEAGQVADRPRTAQLVEVQRRVSEETGCAFFDVVAFMGGPLSMQQWVELEYGQSDYIHFTRAGYERLGRALFEAVMRDYPAPLPEAGAALAGR